MILEVLRSWCLIIALIINLHCFPFSKECLTVYLWEDYPPSICSSTKEHKRGYLNHLLWLFVRIMGLNNKHSWSCLENQTNNIFFLGKAEFMHYFWRQPLYIVKGSFFLTSVDPLKSSNIDSFDRQHTKLAISPICQS